ncbi:MAG: hypothetical protein QMD61_08850 [Methanobacterium sp.]|nr:hypothetical protein [Methanobacterium sp.]
MKFKRADKTDDNPEELLDKAYNCNSNELQKLLEKIEAKIKSEGNNELLFRAKSVITTKMILEKENNAKVYSK